MTVARKKPVNNAHTGQLNLFDLFLNGPSASSPILTDAPGLSSAVVEVVEKALQWTFFPDGFIPKGPAAQLKANLAAIKALRQGENADPATLMRFVGWGGLANIFNNLFYQDWISCQQEGKAPYAGLQNWINSYGKAALEVRQQLTAEEYRAAETALLTAYYTPTALVRAIWNGVERLGFRGGKVLEPAAGIGYFLGLMPEHLVRASEVTAIEKDQVSGQICKRLFPDATVLIGGFEEQLLKPESFDLVISNVPFGQLKVVDPHYKALSRYDIHNYFIGKSACLLREGGILAVVTSTGTMDNRHDNFRTWLSGEAMMELAGAVRLPGGYFYADAGTEVSTDVLFFVKQEGVAKRFNTTYNRVSVIRTVIDPQKNENEADRAIPIAANEYFTQNPGQILGEMVLNQEVGGGMYRGDKVQCYHPEPASVDVMKALEILPRLNRQSKKAEVAPVAEQDPYAGAVTIAGRTFRQRYIIDHYEKLKAAYFDLRGAEGGASNESYRQKLTFHYETFISQFGVLNRNKGLNFLKSYDHYFALMQALEVNKGGRWVKSDLFYHDLGEGQPITSVETLDDAITLSMWQFGYLHKSQMAGWLNMEVATLEGALTGEGKAFRLPGQPGKLIERSEYLSGHIGEKLQLAQSAAEEDPRFEPNVKALEAALPIPIPFILLTFSMSSSWIPTDVFTGFVREVLKIQDGKVTYNERSREFSLSDCHSRSSVENQAFGTKELAGHELLEKALNGRSINITKTVYDASGNKKLVADPEATAEAIGQQESLNEVFIDYVTANWQEAVEKAYNDRFNQWVDRPYSQPQYKHYPGASTTITLRKHQFRAVERIKKQDTCLAHGVGSGKTFSIISGVMELKRLRLAKKAMVVVQNSTLQNFVDAWKLLYPTAALMYPQGADFEKDGRRVFLQRVAHCDIDAVIIPQSMLRLIPDELASLVEFVSEESDRLLALAEEEERRKGDPNKRTVKRLNALRERIEARREQQAQRRTDDMLSFEMLGIDALFIDEAHNYKRLGLVTNRTRIKGIDTQGSEQALSAMCKIRSVQNRGGRVVLATGTPISNTMAEAWTILRYIAPERLKSSQIDTFDHFAGSFGKVVPSFELTPTGQFKAVERFAKFINVRSLIELFRSHVDIVLNDEVDEFKVEGGNSLIPALKDGKFTSIQLDMTDEVCFQLERIKETLRDYEKLSGAEKREKSHIPLVMFGQARKVTIDPRLIDPTLPTEQGGKLEYVANEIFRLYQQSRDYRGTQLVFSDVFQSPPVKAGSTAMLFSEEGEEITEEAPVAPEYVVFNAFEELKTLLIEKGIPAEEIAFVPQKPERREAVFAKVREGVIRVLMGSTERMGVGVNVQNRVCGIHHVDAPNRPTDFEQRNGRGLRQGNMLAALGIPMEILTYGVRRTMDATAYGRLAMKQKFINQLLKGQLQENTCTDISGDDEFSAMSFDEMMATLSGSQTALLYVGQKLELTRLEQAEKNHARRMKEANWQIRLANARVEDYTRLIPRLEQQEADILQHFGENRTVHTLTIDGMEFTTEFGKALKPVFERLSHRFRRGDSAATERILMNGQPVILSGYMTTLDTRTIIGVRYEYGMVEGKVTVPGALVRSLEAAIEGRTGLVDNYKALLQREHKVITEFTNILSQPFTGKEKLDELRVRVAELEKQLQAETDQPTSAAKVVTVEATDVMISVEMEIDSPVLEELL